MIVPDNHINGRVHFNSANLGAAQILFVIDMMNPVIFDDRKYTSQVADNPGLPTVMNIASSDDMRSDALFAPSFQLCQTDTFPFRLRSVLVF